MLGTFELAAPTLLRYEIGSVCLKKIKKSPEDRDLFLGSLSLFDEIGVREIVVPIDPIVAIAEAMGLSTYDSSYLWLSRALEVPLVTLDQKLLQASTT